MNSLVILEEDKENKDLFTYKSSIWFYFKWLTKYILTAAEISIEISISKCSWSTCLSIKQIIGWAVALKLVVQCIVWNLIASSLSGDKNS